MNLVANNGPGLQPTHNRHTLPQYPQYPFPSPPDSQLEDFLTPRGNLRTLPEIRILRSSGLVNPADIMPNQIPRPGLCSIGLWNFLGIVLQMRLQPTSMAAHSLVGM
jgi:hypothetical protein